MQVPPEHIKQRNAIDPKMNRIAEVTIGSLPFVHAGSIWKDGRFIEPAATGYKREEFDLNIADSNTRVIRLGDPIPVSGNQRVHLPLQSLFAPLTDNAILNEWRETRLLAVDTGRAAQNQNKILIPITELVRFYYFSSKPLPKLCSVRGLKNCLIPTPDQPKTN
jgi:hypothetical protein